MADTFSCGGYLLYVVYWERTSENRPFYSGIQNPCHSYNHAVCQFIMEYKIRVILTTTQFASLLWNTKSVSFLQPRSLPVYYGIQNPCHSYNLAVCHFILQYNFRGTLITVSFCNFILDYFIIYILFSNIIRILFWNTGLSFHPDG